MWIAASRLGLIKMKLILILNYITLKCFEIMNCRIFSKKKFHLIIIAY